MKKTVLTVLAVVAAGAVAWGDLLIGIDTAWGTGWNNATVTATGASGGIMPTAGVANKAQGSADGTFGGAFSGADNVNAGAFYGAYELYLDTHTLQVNIENTTLDQNMILTGFHFDSVREFAASPWRASVTTDANGVVDASSEVGVTFLTQVGISIPTGNTYTGFTNTDIDLAAALTDNVVAPGETAIFHIAVTGGSGATWATSYVDNIGISGSFEAIPEPATVGLLATFGSALMLIRRRVIRA